MRNILQTFNASQTAYRAILSQLLPNVSGAYLDYLLISIDSDLTSPLRVDATSTPSLVVNVGSSVVANPESDRNRSIPFINDLMPSFTSGFVTFPSTSGSNITTSTGGSTLLTLPSGQYAKVLILMDSSGNLSTVVGGPNASPTAATVPPPLTNTLPIAYVLLQNLGGTIQNITQSNIYQIASPSASSSSSGSTSLWLADEVPLSISTTSYTVNFTSPQTDTSYIILPMMENLVDAHPLFQEPLVTNKTTTSFTVQWDQPLDTANYILSYIVPPKALVFSELAVGSSVNNFNPTLLSPQPASNYGTIAVLQNLVDANPQFQPLTIGNNSTTNLDAKWSSPTDSSNYQLVNLLGYPISKKSLSSGISSITVPLPVGYGTNRYGIIATMQNTVDSLPKMQPLLVTAKSASNVTISWPSSTDTANYILAYYVISLTS